eukprot:125204-Chlamydomonas_euryale.AAC.3
MCIRDRPTLAHGGPVREWLLWPVILTSCVEDHHWYGSAGMAAVVILTEKPFSDGRSWVRLAPCPSGVERSTDTRATRDKERSNSSEKTLSGRRTVVGGWQRAACCDQVRTV